MSSNTSLAGRTAIVTGAGSGLGRSEALALAAAGANVVVNDIDGAADEVVTEISAHGADAVAVSGDVRDWNLGKRLVDTAVDSFGSLDILVNNAGVLRDKMLFNLTESDWDDVIGIHLKGHASVSTAAATHWREKSKSSGDEVYGRVINTASEAFLFGAAGQPNYSAAKAGIVALTLSTASGLGKYGVRANAICPRARTGMTSGVFGDDAAGADAAAEDLLAPERVATFVSYLAAPAAHEISGQVFVVYGDMVALLAAPSVEQKFVADTGSFSVDELDSKVSTHFKGRSPYQSFAAYSVAELDMTATGYSTS